MESYIEKSISGLGRSTTFQNPYQIDLKHSLTAKSHLRKMPPTAQLPWPDWTQNIFTFSKSGEVFGGANPTTAQKAQATKSQDTLLYYKMCNGQRREECKRRWKKKSKREMENGERNPLWNVSSEGSEPAFNPAQGLLPQIGALRLGEREGAPVKQRFLLLFLFPLQSSSELLHCLSPFNNREPMSKWGGLCTPLFLNYANKGRLNQVVKKK